MRKIPEIKLDTTDCVANPITTAKIPPAINKPERSSHGLEVKVRNEIAIIPK